MDEPVSQSTGSLCEIGESISGAAYVHLRLGIRTNWPLINRGYIKWTARKRNSGNFITRVVQKLQFLNNNRLKTAKCEAFCLDL
jgi:hypothetical protein